jgi:hypothetical protein
MMSEMASNYRRANAALSDNKRLQKIISRSAAEKLSAEESHAQQIAQNAGVSPMVLWLLSLLLKRSFSPLKNKSSY